MLAGPDGWAVFQTLLHTPATLRYSMPEDFAPVARVASFPIALVADARLGVRDLAGLKAWLQAHPDRASYGTAGAGGQMEFFGREIALALKSELVLVPYQGGGPLATGLLGGQVPMALMPGGGALQLPAERVVLLGLLSDRRWSLAPGVRTFAEQGLPISASEAWLGWWAPARTPVQVMARIEQALATTLAEPAVRLALSQRAFVVPDFQPGSELDRSLRAELQRWTPRVKAAGMAPAS